MKGLGIRSLNNNVLGDKKELLEIGILKFEHSKIRFLEFGNLISDVCMFSFRMLHCSFSMFNLLVYSTGSSS